MLYKPTSEELGREKILNFGDLTQRGVGRVASLSVAPKLSSSRLHKTIYHLLQIVFLDVSHTRVASIVRQSTLLTDETRLQSS